MFENTSYLGEVNRGIVTKDEVTWVHVWRCAAVSGRTCPMKDISLHAVRAKPKIARTKHRFSCQGRRLNHFRCMIVSSLSTCRRRPWVVNPRLQMAGPYMLSLSSASFMQIEESSRMLRTPSLRTWRLTPSPISQVSMLGWLTRHSVSESLLGTRNRIFTSSNFDCCSTEMVFRSQIHGRKKHRPSHRTRHWATPSKIQEIDEKE